MNQKGILLFGGTFDPIHHGHLIIARAAAERLSVEKTILIPSAQPPHKTAFPLSTAEDRLLMTKLAVARDESFDVSDCELSRPGPSYTLETVRHFRGIYPNPIPLYWLIGADSISELPGWYQIKQLAEECTIVTAARPGSDPHELALLRPALSPSQIDRIKQHILDTPMIDISATDIRRRAGLGLSIKYLTSNPVALYIIEHGLYKD